MIPAALGPGVYSVSNRIENQEEKLKKNASGADKLTAIFTPV
jgi:hypothetical protein